MSGRAARRAAPLSLARPLAALLAGVALAVLPGVEAAGGVARAGGAGCGAVRTTVDEGHGHLLGDATPPVGYQTVPPASGWHYTQRTRLRLGAHAASDALSEPEQVTVLAAGGVVIGYRDLDERDVAGLAEVVAAAGQRPVALTPYGRLEPGEVALSAWRTVQRCDGVDLARVEAFVEEHAAAEPDYSMSGGEAAHADGGHGEAGEAGAGGWSPWWWGAVLVVPVALAWAVVVRRARRRAPA